MKLRAVVLGLATLCTSTATFAGMVSTSSNLEFLAIDGQKPLNLSEKLRHLL